MNKKKINKPDMDSFFLTALIHSSSLISSMRKEQRSDGLAERMPKP